MDVPQGFSSRVLVEHVRCAQDKPRGCIRYAARRWHQSYPVLLRVAVCESRLNPYAHNPSGASGLMQFMPSTWQTTPYRRRSIWSARWSALAAGYMWHVGRQHEWSCF
jgi:soluble lytic murein transglycosylase-like protein